MGGRLKTGNRGRVGDDSFQSKAWERDSWAGEHREVAVGLHGVSCSFSCQSGLRRR